MTVEGRVAVRLSPMGGRVARAAVSIRRPQAARALIGRTPDQAVRLIPALFSLCGTAQTVAALTACESALGIDASVHGAARRLLILAERAVMHGWQVAIDWPPLLREGADPTGLAELRAAGVALGRALYPDGDGLRLGGGRLAPDGDATADAVGRIAGWFRDRLFGGDPPRDAGGLTLWAKRGASAAARLAARLLDPRSAAFGAGPVPTLPMQGAAWFARRMADDPGFCLLPRFDAGPALTGPLARRAAHPLVAPLAAEYGSGLAAHLAARLADIAELGRELRTDGGTPADGFAEAGVGCGVVETVRGRLAHRVRLGNDGRIADHRIVAPTEWNFAPDGALTRGVEGSPAGSDLEDRVRLLVAMLDPCVPCTITLDAEERTDA